MKTILGSGRFRILVALVSVWIVIILIAGCNSCADLLQPDFLHGVASLELPSHHHVQYVLEWLIRMG